MKTKITASAVAAMLFFAAPAMAQQTDIVPNASGGYTAYSFGSGGSSTTDIVPNASGGYSAYTIGPNGSSSTTDIIPNGSGGYTTYTFGPYGQ